MSFGGLVVSILTGVFADKAISGIDASVTMQAIAAFGTLLYSGVATFIILKIVSPFVSLRIDA